MDSPDEIQKLKDEIKILHWFLREIQWSGKAPTTPDLYCPACLRPKSVGHAQDCVIAVSLAL